MTLRNIINRISGNPYSPQLNSHVFTISPEKREKIEIYKENIESKVIDYVYRLENADEQINETPSWNPNRLILRMQTKNHKKNLTNLIAEYAVLEQLSSQYDEVTERVAREESEQIIIPAVFVDRLVNLHHNYKKMGGTKTYQQFDDLVSKVLESLNQ